MAVTSTDASIDLAVNFLQGLADLERSTEKRWRLKGLYTRHGYRERNLMTEYCYELFVPFSEAPQKVVWQAVMELLRREGQDPKIQAYAGLILLNFVHDYCGSIDEILTILGPKYDVSDHYISAWLARTFRVEIISEAIERVSGGTTDENVRLRLNGVLYQVKCSLHPINAQTHIKVKAQSEEKL